MSIILDNNMHAYVYVKERIKADYDAPYRDGSYIDKKSSSYKYRVKEDEKNYSFLSKYIESGLPLEICNIRFPRRDGGAIDSISCIEIDVFDNSTKEYYTFNAKSFDDEISVSNKDYYYCELDFFQDINKTSDFNHKRFSNKI